MMGYQSTPSTKCVCGVVRIRNQWSGADQKPRLEKMCLDLLNEAINSLRTSEPKTKLKNRKMR